MATIKNMMRSMVPECKVFLDVDDLDSIERLEDHVEATDVVRSPAPPPRVSRRLSS